MKEDFLEIKDLKQSFGTGEARQEVLRGMNFTVKKGEVYICHILRNVSITKKARIMPLPLMNRTSRKISSQRKKRPTALVEAVSPSS